MASVLLSAVGTAAGTAVAGPLGAAVGARLFGFAGSALDNAVFGPTKLPGYDGPRLTELLVQTSTYGKMIPLVYGAVRLAGNIIWSRPIEETAVTSTVTAGGGKGGGKVSQTSTSYAYSVSLAIAICEGEIDEILRVWADSKLLDLSQGNYRLYTGSEDQLPDSFIEGVEGVGSTPAYRGLAYVVIEDFPLEAFGNRIPNFTFEVKKRAKPQDTSSGAVEDLLTAIALIPGSGEFVYDTQVQYKVPGQQVGSDWIPQGNRERVNQHNSSGKSNALVSLDQLQETLPNIEWISVVCNWFGTDMDAGSCDILPGVEYQYGATTEPDAWAVAGFDRSSAHQITLVNDSPVYGGTPDDDSILRLLDELAGRGYKILFYPMMLMDTANKPWRGRLTASSASDVSAFFNKTNGYNAFITHYANLVSGKVDAFLIGSEMVDLNKYSNTTGNYPAVNEFVSLAATVKGILGSGVKISYAGDWSEYHHTDGGWHHLDPLWSSSNIDFVAIDAYFPLTDAPQNGYDLQEVIDGWTSGEGYDWYYTDAARTIKASLSPAYAWKNIEWWWKNSHVNPDSSTTAWVPQSKKIWFTEYGFPSVDGATNQPNVFYDPTSSESYFPYHSKGRVDFRAQRLGVAATEIQWGGSSMVEHKFLWTWDARPFPYWPDLTEVWADGGNWLTGHWVQGKFGISSLAAIVADLCNRAGLQSGDYDVTRLDQLVEGYALTSRDSIRRAIETLQLGYFFDAVETDGLLKFIPRGNESAVTIPKDDVIPGGAQEKRELLEVVRRQEIELPKDVEVLYLNSLRQYQPNTQRAQRMVTQTEEKVSLNLPIVFSDQDAKTVADVTLYSAWMNRTTYRFDLPMEYAWLEPADVVTVVNGTITHTLRITRAYIGKPGIVRVEGVAEDVTIYDQYTPPGETSTLTQDAKTPGETVLRVLDLPALPADGATNAMQRFALCGRDSDWTGSVLYRSDDGGNSYGRLLSVTTPAVMGTALTVLPDGPSNVFDEAASVTISLLGGGELESVSALAVLNGANMAWLGDEMIQFRQATLEASGNYTLSGLLRGRLGTEDAMPNHLAGEGFVLLSPALEKETVSLGSIGLTRQYKPVTIGQTLGSTAEQSFAYQGRAMKPYAPVHVSGSRDGIGNLAVTWVRRTRSGGEWRDGVDVPLSEETEAYEVEILNGSTVVRTISGLGTPTASYSAAEQIADFGSAQSSVSIRVYQLSAVVGRGITASAVV